MIDLFLIINRSGNVIYSYKRKGAPINDTNKILILGGIVHSLYSISDSLFGADFSEAVASCTAQTNAKDTTRDITRNEGIVTDSGEATSTMISINQMTMCMKNKKMHLYRTLQGTIFVFLADESIEKAMKGVYSHYCRYVLGNPFYKEDSLIKIAKFKPEKFFNQSGFLNFSIF